MRDSPQIKSAEAQVARARAVLIRAKAEPIPDMYVRGGIGYSSEFLENRQGNVIGRTGVEANAQVGVSLPLWNRNQGGIAAAQAELAFTENELSRLRLALRVQFAQAIKNYGNAVDAVRRYRDVMLPRADQAYQLYLAKYKQMGASYPQVLISQRTMFQLRQQYINALVDLQQNATHLEGYLLTGGLDAPSLTPGSNVQRVEMTGVRSGSQGSDQHDLDTAGLVEY
jgi:cobalt-zinc-cadmium efflux system outer membrane protein